MVNKMADNHHGNDAIGSAILGGIENNHQAGHNKNRQPCHGKCNHTQT